MRNFAKLFEYEDIGQIAVISQDNDEGCPEIRFFFTPEGLGTCSVAIGFGEGEYDKADLGFENTNEQTARDIVDSVLKSLAGD